MSETFGSRHQPTEIRLKREEKAGIEGVVCGRALYDGRIDPAAALRLLAGEGGPC